MKLALLFSFMLILAEKVFSQSFAARPTVTIEQKWSVKPGKKGGYVYDWVVKDKAGNVIGTYHYDIFTPFAGNIILVGNGKADTKYPYRKAQQFGLLDATTGKEVYPCTAFSIEKRSMCLVDVTEDKKHFLLKPSGEKLFDAPFEQVNGRIGEAGPGILVKKDGKYGFIDSCGTLRTQLIYDQATYFSQGVARVQRGGKWTLLDSNMKELGPPRFQSIDMFYTEVTAYSMTAETNMMGYYWKGKRGLINLKGEVLTEEIYDEITYADNMINARIGSQWVQIDPKAVKTSLANPTASVPQVDREFHKQTKWGYYKYGYKLGYNWFIKPKYDMAYAFQGNFAVVGNEGKDKMTTYGGATVKAIEYGLINTKGEVIVPTKYKALWLYENGLYGFAEGKGDYYTWKMGILDTNGVVRVPAEYNNMGELKEGLIAAGKDKKYGYIDLSGKTIIPHTYFLATPFTNGVACVADSYNSWYWIDKKGKELFPGKRFTSVSDWDSSGRAWTWNKMDQWNRPDSALLITRTGKVVGSRPLNGPPPPPRPNSTVCTKCHGSGQAYKSRDVSSSFTWVEGMFKPVETRTTTSYSYKVYEKDGACTQCGGDGYQ